MAHGHVYNVMHYLLIRPPDLFLSTALHAQLIQRRQQKSVPVTLSIVTPFARNTLFSLAFRLSARNNINSLKDPMSKPSNALYGVFFTLYNNVMELYT